MKGINVIATVEFAKQLVTQPNLLIPHLSVKNIADIPFQTLKEMGFKGVVFDKDNTLTHPKQPCIVKEVQTALILCQSVFSRQNVVIFSNSAGSYDDRAFHEAIELEKVWGIPILKHNTKKPDGREYLATYFKDKHVALDELIMVGDRYSTDVLFGHRCGMLTIRTDQLTQRGEGWFSVLLQRIESQLVQRVLARRYAAPVHSKYKQ